MRKSLFKFAVLPAAIAMLSGCGQDGVIHEKPSLSVSAYEITKPIENHYRNFKGTVMPADLTPISFRIDGELDAILVKPGQKVKKGQLLAKLDDSKLRQQLADAEVQYHLTVKQLGRGKDLLRKKMISDSEYDELNANNRIAEVNYQVAKNNLEYTRLLAPFDGYVSDVPKKSFESVNPGETVLSVYRDDVVRVRIGISDTVLARISPDMDSREYKIPTRFSGDERDFVIEYYEHSSEPNEGGNAFELWLEMPQVNPPILPGTTASLNVDMMNVGFSLIQGYEIPVTAVDAGSKEGEFYVWKYTDGTVQKVGIDVVKVNSRGVVVLKGVRQGDLLVNSSLKKLRNGSAVQIVGEEN